MKVLYKQGITSVFVEGGSRTLGSFFDQKLADKLYIFVAPRIMGKSSGLSSIGGQGTVNINRLTELRDLTIERTGVDFLVTAYPHFI